MSPALTLYLLAARLAAPFARLLLARRAARGKEDPARLGERMGLPGLPRPAGQLVWLHGASVGEAMAALALI
ncbi:MAG: 3-deoxy-D-manno-octulosonic acid transferase, partial [Rhodobacterales bacterium CG18_big_fil_WC_8_21_14_2_50_71_9]